MDQGLLSLDDSTALDEVKAAKVVQHAASQAVIDAVMRARDTGSSWAAIGRRLGITKQGAQQRYDDDNALIQAVAESCTRGQLAVPKAMTLYFPPFAWIKDALIANIYGDASLNPDGSDAYVAVPLADFQAHHPVDTTRALDFG